MGMRAAFIAVVMAAVVFPGRAASEAQDRGQQRPMPRTPGGVSGAPRPDPTGQPGQPRRPVRDPRQPPVEGTATVRGRVVDGTTGHAIARAKVRIGNRDPRNSRMATTDAEGVFTLTKVPSGPLMLMVEKAAYLAVIYPERRRSMRASSLQIADGQTIDGVTIPMFRGGAITGRVVDAYGDPVEFAMVHMFFAPQSNRSSPSAREGTRASHATNDIGEYRLGRLEPGQYYVMVAPQQHRNLPEDTGNALGRTWYPGVASFDQAQPILLERGASLAGVDFQMLETTLTRVSGLVMTSKGTPAKGGHVSARATNGSKGMPQGAGMGWTAAGGTGIDQYGNFDIMLQPGEYTFEASAAQDEEARKQGRSEMDRGQVRLVVGGESMSGVTIATGSGGSASGRFVFKGASPPPSTSSGFSINFTGASGGAMGNEDCRSSNRANVNADGTFSAEHLWGTCQIRGAGFARGWVFESVMHNGNDITSRAIEFGMGRSISGIEVIFTDRIGEISMTVSDDRGTPTEDYVAVVFPVDKEKWGDQRFLRTQTMTPRANTANAASAAPGYTAGRVAASTFDPSSVMVMNEMFGGGASTVRNILAGDYYAVAVDDTAYEDLRDPEYLERLAQMATRVSLSAGETQAVQLRRVKAPQ
jgi:hypothetical protein